MRDYVALANQYVADVLAGTIPACRWTKMACQRQRDDVARQGQPGFAFTFDAKKAARVCAFCELLVHIKGPKGGKALILESWQCFVLTTVFGWLRADGTRRFRRAFIEVAKGNGKSLLSSVLCLFMLCADGEAGSEVVTSARTTKQARIVFDTCRDMCRANRKLCEKYGIEALQHTITQKRSNSVCFPVSSQAGSLEGLQPHYAVADELHAHRKRDVLDSLESSVRKRRSGLVWSITTAGEDLASVGYAEHSAAQAILEGTIRDEATFGVIYSIDPEQSWESEEAWRCANPNWNVSVFPTEFAEEYERSRLLPARQANFRTKNLNTWLGGDISWLDPAKVGLGHDRTLKESDFYGQPCVQGLDLASRQDMVAVVRVYSRFIDGEQHFYSFGKYYLPEKAIEASPVAAYRGWVARGILVSQTGATTNLQQVEDDIVAHSKLAEIKATAFDDWQACQLVGNLQRNNKLLMVEFRKNAKTYSPVMDWFSALVLEKRFHFNDPILAWGLANVVCHRDANGNLFPRKPDSNDRKIDSAVALLFALRLALNKPSELLPKGVKK